MRSRRRPGWAATIVAALAATTMAAFTPAVASAEPADPAGTAVVGEAPVLPARTTLDGAVDDAMAVQLTIALQPRDPAALADFAQAVATPGSGEYGRYLARGQFARRFGPTDATIAAITKALTGLGLSPGPVSANHLSIPVTTTARRAQSAFAVQLRRARLASGRVAFANTSPPRLPASVARSVQAIVGLDNLARAVPLYRTKVPAGAGQPLAAVTPSGGPAPCAAASTAAANATSYTADQLAAAYGFNGLYAKGFFGAGQTIALYELAGYNPADIAAYQSCYGTSAAVTRIPVDGGANPGDSGDVEAELDIEGVIGVAPNADIVVYEGPNGGPGQYDTFSRIVSDDVANVVSVSWGLCEAHAGFTQMENTLFQQAATQGQTVVAASGDNGSEDCNDGSAALAVDDPASQPFVTGVGGTNLSVLGPPPTEVAWNDVYGAGGGGISSLWPMPAYQQGPGVANGYSNGRRQVPDVAASADPQHGYLIWYTGREFGGRTGWFVIGGTSAAAPLWAGLIALANQNCGCTLGFVNPALYRAAAAAGSFRDITSGNNDYQRPATGTYPATPGYDMASGLGAPVADALAAGLNPKAMFTYPTDNQSAVDSTRPFTWAPVSQAQGYLLAVGTAPNAVDLVNSGVLPPTRSSFPVPALPTGKTLYGLLFTELNGSWATYQSITFTAAPGQATLTYPTNGQAGVDTTRAFTWSTIAPAQGYILTVGTTRYGTDLVNSGVLAPARSSYPVPALPGKTLYATLLTEVNGGWGRFQVVTFTAAPGQGALTYPTAGQAGVDTTRPFTWTTVPQAQGYLLAVGTTPNGADLVNSGILPAGRASYPIPALPTGRTLYATLFTGVNGNWARFQSATFTAAPGLATLTSPVNGQAAVDPAVTFNWSALPQGQGYLLAVGTSRYGTDLVNSGVLPASQTSYRGPLLPAGRTLYALLFTEVNGAWARFQDIVFTTR